MGFAAATFAMVYAKRVRKLEKAKGTTAFADPSLLVTTLKTNATLVNVEGLQAAIKRRRRNPMERLAFPVRSVLQGIVSRACVAKRDVLERVWRARRRKKVAA